MPRREQFRVKSAQNKEKCHVLPCKINHNGTVDVSKLPISKKVDGSYVSSFRGRPLLGRQVELPGYTGAVLEEAQPIDDEEEFVAELSVKQQFDTLIVWEHGQDPLKDDPWAGRLQELIAMSSIIHDI